MYIDPTTMKRFYIIIFSIFICIGSSAQKLKYTPQQDSIWVVHLLKNLKERVNKINPMKGREEQREWISGNIVYSPDSCVRIAQLGKDYNTVQYVYHNKIIEYNLPSENDAFYFQNYPIREIHKLPDSTKQAYLIISSNQEEGDERATNVASAIVLGTDSLKEFPFLRIPEVYYYPPEYEEIEIGKSIGVGTSIDKGGNTPIKYDPINNEVHFINSHCVEYDMNGKCDRPYMNFYEGIFEYTDTAFVLRYDSIYYDPPLETFKKTIATKIYNIGNHTIKAWAVSTYEEIGMGVLPVFTVNYKIGKDTISEITHGTSVDDGNKLKLKPDYKLQKDGSLIILTTDSTVPNHSGMCGMCQNDESTFWLIKNGSIKKLFSFISNSGRPFTEYEYNVGKTKRTGWFYLKKIPKEEEEWNNGTLVEAYWKNNSIYGFKMEDEEWARDFYIHFDTEKGFAIMEVGKMLKLNKQ